MGCNLTEQIKHDVPKLFKKFLQEDVFVVTAIDLGILKKLRIRHDNTQPYSSWYLDRVEIVDTQEDVT